MYYFAINPIRSTCTMWANYPVTEQVGTASKLRQRMENLPSSACAHVLHKTLNLVVSRCYRELKQRRRQRQRKTSPENISLFHLCYFAIISTRSTLTKMANYPGTKLVRVAYKLRKKMKNLSSCVHVLHKTLMWSFHVVVLQRTAKKCTKMWNARAERLFLLIKPIVLRHCRCRRRRRCLRSPLNTRKTCAEANSVNVIKELK